MGTRVPSEKQIYCRSSLAPNDRRAFEPRRDKGTGWSMRSLKYSLGAMPKLPRNIVVNAPTLT